MGPETLAILSLASTVIGGGISAIGQMQQASAAKDQANYQAQVAVNNAEINRQNAARAAQAGRQEAWTLDVKNMQRMGGIVAAEAASGIDLGSGSSREVQKAAANLGRLDTATTFDKAMMQVRSYNVAAQSDLAQSQLDRMRASSAGSAGMFGALGSVVSTAGSFADKWTRMADAGIGGSGSTNINLGDLGGGGFPDYVFNG